MFYGMNPLQQYQNMMMASAPAGYPNTSFYQPQPRPYAPTTPFPNRMPAPWQSLITRMSYQQPRRLPLLPYGGYPQGRGTAGPYSPYAFTRF